MKVLVTRGIDFIGKHLVKSLLEKGDLVAIFNNFSNSTKDSISHSVNKGYTNKGLCCNRRCG